MERSYYLITELPLAGKDFRDIFSTGITEFIENHITAVTGKLIINIPLFHSYLYKENPGYESESFNTLLKERYGEKGIKIIKKLTL